MKPERSHYFDAGVDQTVLPGLTLGLDAYYKMARDMIDDGQFGAAVVLTQFNYAKGYSEGGEFKLKYNNDNFNAYANFAYNITRANDVGIEPVSARCRDLRLSPHQLALHRRHAAHDRLGRGVVRWHDTPVHGRPDLRQRPARRRFSRWLRAQFVATTPYAVINIGVAHEFAWSTDDKPLTVRFDVVNLFDQIYEMRDGCGIGVFAPQFGARRGYYIGISQKL